MSVPTHNLYDFVHLLTKKQFFLMYFYPWGSRDIKDVTHYQTSKEGLDGPYGIPLDNRKTVSTIIADEVDHRLAARIQPTILCHDQEPLWFDQYCADSYYMQDHCDQYYNRLKLKISPTHRSQNLRAAFPESLQQAWILLHSELNSYELERYEATGLFVGAYWWSHAIIARDWYRFAEHDTALQSNQNYDKLFLVYAREFTGWRAYRKEFLETLDSLEISTHCQTQSFHQKPVGPEASATYEADDINRTAISVVLETVVDDRIHLTEKVLRPIACGHPFMLAAGPSSLKLLQKYGFKTFAPYINEDYDSIQNKEQRLNAVAKEMQRLSQLPANELESIINNCRAIALENKKHFFSKEFYNTVTSELMDNVLIAHSKFNGELDFNSWWEGRKWHHANQHSEFKNFEQEHNFGSVLVPAYRKLRSNR